MAPAVRGQTSLSGRSDGCTVPPSLVDTPIAVQVRNLNGAGRCSCVLCALRQARAAWEEADGRVNPTSRLIACLINMPENNRLKQWRPPVRLLSDAGAQDLDL